MNKFNVKPWKYKQASCDYALNIWESNPHITSNEVQRIVLKVTKELVPRRSLRYWKGKARIRWKQTKTARIPSKLIKVNLCELARVLGHLIGDGCIYVGKGSILLHYRNENRALREQLKKDIHVLFSINPSAEYGTVVEWWSVDVGNYLLSLLPRNSSFASGGWRIPKIIKNSSPNIQSHFVRSLFNDDGSVRFFVSPSKHHNMSIALHRGIILTSFCAKGLEEIKKLLWQSFKIYSKVTTATDKYKKLDIRDKNDKDNQNSCRLFANRINFSKGVYVSRGKWWNYKNSMVEHRYEKRAILDYLLDSYENQNYWKQILIKRGVKLGILQKRN